jgi:hypothetical protein
MEMPLRVLFGLALVVLMASGVVPVSAQLVNGLGGSSPSPSQSPKPQAPSPAPGASQEAAWPDLEGNWFVERQNRPDATSAKTVVVLARGWDLKCVKEGAACRYRNEITRTTWMAHTTDYSNWGAAGAQVTSAGVKYRWGWGSAYETTMVRTGPNELRGRWSLYDGSSGVEIWRRAVADVDRAEFTIILGNAPQRTIIWTKGQPPPRLEGPSGQFTAIRVKVLGTNLWGHQLLDAGGAIDLQPQVIWGTYLVGKRMEAPGRPPTYLQTGAHEGSGDVRTIIGLQKQISFGPLVRPGMKVFRVGSIAIPFELILTDSKTAALDETGQKKSLRFVQEIVGGAFEPLRELAYNRPFRIEAAFAPPHATLTREATVTWDGNSAGRKVVLKLMADGIFRSDPLTVVPPEER